MVNHNISQQTARLEAVGSKRLKNHAVKTLMYVPMHIA